MTQHGLKKSLQLALEANDLGAAVALVRNDRKALSLLVRLAYDKDTLIGWRATKAVGLATRELPIPHDAAAKPNSCIDGGSLCRYTFTMAKRGETVCLPQ